MRAEDTGHVSKLCVKTLFPSETFILNFIAFFVLVGIDLFGIPKMLSSVTVLQQNGSLTPAIVFHLLGASQR